LLHAQRSRCAPARRPWIPGRLRRRQGFHSAAGDDPADCRANVTWDGSSNSDWGRKQNWSTGNVPVIGDDAFFASGFSSSGTAINLDGS
jgi:hypothetical protein